MTVWTKRLLKIGAIALAVWLVLSASLFAVMRQPPIVFNHVMAKTPMVAFLVLPFETLWLHARRGTLHVGDVAPDFTLKTSDRSAEVSLSSFRGQKPVVLVFGSHT
jgi:AhpC/TSA family